MSGKHIEFKRRSIMSFLLAVLITAITAIPALAWEVEESPKRQPAQLKRVTYRTSVTIRTPTLISREMED